eukprot:gene19528-26203_t
MWGLGKWKRHADSNEGAVPRSSTPASSLSSPKDPSPPACSSPSTHHPGAHASSNSKACAYSAADTTGQWQSKLSSWITGFHGPAESNEGVIPRSSSGASLLASPKASSPPASFDPSTLHPVAHASSNYKACTYSAAAANAAQWPSKLGNWTMGFHGPS